MLELFVCLGTCSPIALAVIAVVGIVIEDINDAHNAWRRKRWAKKGK